MASSPTYPQPGGTQTSALAPLHEIPLPGCHPVVTSSFLSPPREQRSLCVPARREPALPRDREQQAAPTPSDSPHPAQTSGPRVGDNVLGPEGGGTGDTRGPLGAWERSGAWRAREEGREEPGRPTPRARGQVWRVPGDRKWHGTRTINTATADPRGGEGRGLGRPRDLGRGFGAR